MWCLQRCSFSGLLWLFEVVCGTIRISGFFSISMKIAIKILRNCIQSTDGFVKYEHFNDINSSNPWTQKIFLVLSVFFWGCLNFFFLLKWICHICSCIMIMKIQFHRISIPQPKHTPIPQTVSSRDHKFLNASESASILQRNSVSPLFRIHMSVKEFDVAFSLYGWRHLAW